MTPAPASFHLRRSSKMVGVMAGAASALLLAAWYYMLLEKQSTWLVRVTTSLAALLAGLAYAFNIRFKPGRLLGFGKHMVQVRSLDEWCVYQYGVSFDQASLNQQHEALKHYRVGLRLFPARPQDAPAKQNISQWLVSFLTFCSFVTLSEFVHGSKRLLLVGVFYIWIWMCLRVSRRFANTVAANDLAALHLSE